MARQANLMHLPKYAVYNIAYCVEYCIQQWMHLTFGFQCDRNDINTNISFFAKSKDLYIIINNNIYHFSDCLYKWVIKPFIQLICSKHWFSQEQKWLAEIGIASCLLNCCVKAISQNVLLVTPIIYQQQILNLWCKKTVTFLRGGDFVCDLYFVVDCPLRTLLKLNGGLLLTATYKFIL